MWSLIGQCGPIPIPARWSTSIHLEWLSTLLWLLLKETIELALLQVADKDLLLLRLSHLAELPELVLLENAEGFEIGDPLLADLVVVYLLVSKLVGTLRVEVLATDNVHEFVVLGFFVGSFFATGRFFGGGLEGTFKSLELRLLNTDEF